MTDRPTLYRWNPDTAIEDVWAVTQVEPLRQDLIRDGVLVPVEPDYEAAQREYERHADAVLFSMTVSRSGGKAIVDAALGGGEGEGGTHP